MRRGWWGGGRRKEVDILYLKFFSASMSIGSFIRVFRGEKGKRRLKLSAAKPSRHGDPQHDRVERKGKGRGGGVDGDMVLMDRETRLAH